MISKYLIFVKPMKQKPYVSLFMYPLLLAKHHENVAVIPPDSNLLYQYLMPTDSHYSCLRGTENKAFMRNGTPANSQSQFGP